VVVGRTQPRKCKNFACRLLDSSSDYTDLLTAVDVVVHVAARAHVMNETSSNPLEEFRRINTLATLNLAEQAVKAGIKRFIFISSIKVLGEKTDQDKKFYSDHPLNPKDPYAVSKSEAESGLKQLSDISDMEVVIIRPPLIYGKGVKGNFSRLLRLIALNIPLPFGSIGNSRSLVSIENLVDLICTCLVHPKAANEVFLVSDDHDMSTPELLNLIAKTGGYSGGLFKFPPKLLRLLLISIGKSTIHERLCGSMKVDISHTKTQLEWKPPFKPEDCIANCWSFKA